MEGQILNEIGNAYENGAAAWVQTLLPIAQRLFLLLATIELIWSGIWWALAVRSDQFVLVPILRKVLTLMFFYTVVLLAPSWIPMIIGSFVRAGQAASGFESLDPSTVVQQGIDIAVGMFDSISGILAFLKAPAWLLFAPIVVVLSFSIIAGILLMTLIESYIVLGGGVLLLGFAGSRWTATFAEGYLTYAVRVGVKLFVIYLLIGIGMALPEAWLATLETVEPGDVRYFFEVMGGSLIFAMIIWRVPQFAASMLGNRAHFYMERALSAGE